MENGTVDMNYTNEGCPHEKTEMSNCRTQYGIPDSYNPADQAAVKLRNSSNTDRSEAQRKRRSKNRLSNRRSTGFVNPEIVEEALRLGPQGSQSADTEK